MKGVLNTGRKYGERHYMFLAWSNSQLRDHGCYMYCKTDENIEVAAIREWMGDFSQFQNVPKLMARMGQCFTQSQETFTINLNNTIVDCERDVEGGNYPNTNNPYVFSDGIGKISSVVSKVVSVIITKLFQL